MDYGLSEIHSAGISGACVYRARFYWSGFYLWVKLGSQNRLAAIMSGKEDIYNWKLTITPNRNERNKTTFSEAGAHNKADPNVYLPRPSAKLGLQPHRPGTTL